MIIKVMFFSSGVTAAFEGQEQIPELQVAWFKLYVDLLKEKGIKPEDVDFTMPDRQKVEYMPEYDNWKIV